jgi:hypothetical protein
MNRFSRVPRITKGSSLARGPQVADLRLSSYRAGQRTLHWRYDDRPYPLAAYRLQIDSDTMKILMEIPESVLDNQLLRKAHHIAGVLCIAKRTQAVRFQEV